MKIHNHNATHFLFEKAKSLAQFHDSWRCIYFNFSDQKDQYSDGLRTHFVVKIIKELLADDDGNIYLCDDGDIFILFQGAVKPIIAKLGEHFEGLKSERVFIQPEDNLFTVFDFSQHWQIFFNLCKAKAMQAQSQVYSQPIIGSEASAVAPPPKLLEPDRELFLAAAVKRRSRKQLSVLVVEDDAFTRRLIGGILKDHYNVIEAGDGEEALAAYSSHAPDMVFLDIELPDINGQVVLQKLISLDADAFIVMLSASSFKENILAALEVGAQGFVTKPFAREKLMHYLNMRDKLKHSSASSQAISGQPRQQEARV